MDVFLRGRHGLVYAWKDASELRESHRIVGSLVGCLPHKPRQNIQLGLPLQLLPEEVTLLNELGVVRLLEGTQPLAAPVQAEVEECRRHAECTYQQQAELCKKDREQAIDRQRNEILEGKRAKKRKLREQGGDESLGNEDMEENMTLDEVIITPLSRKNAHVQTPTEEYRTSSKQSHKHADWDFPKTDTEILRYRVFKDLWEKGYFLTGGVKFGGDFLVYPGDPSRYHSFYIAMCVPHYKPLTALELASLGRLGSIVKKTVLLCSSDDKHQLTYVSLNWSHIS